MILEVKKLKKYFGGVKAVDDCSFEIEKGQITALIGPNGAGKSTVFNLISGIIEAGSGNIIFNNRDIINLSPDKISNLGFSRIFQQSSLFNNLTVEDNLFLAFDNDDTKFWKNMLGLNRPTRIKREKIKEMLDLVDMGKFRKQTAGDLSFGQKRLIELIRAIINPHSILMLDEPVAGVNPKLREKISKILLQLKREGETILLIEHDMDFTLNIADKVIVMEKGTVIGEGTPEQIKNNKKVLEAYLGE
jgi:branched-chain amino acid transport system ATP-binding protein/neutral amino acid transport system ATP-binding protein